MSPTQQRPAMASYRDAITELIRADEPFSEVEEAIDGVADLAPDEKAALWLFAYSVRERAP